ncbi:MULTISPECIES: cation-translocating P-type ATPase [unclassified Novosphingobium]|uniref:cation-translocating P-type ATPase n=1 Tax=unclassified Novosphingobium TaxID=2644732 RepID=UPI00086ECE02|nr:MULTISPECIES: cation-translocating P-type ATPase [unclassified Novosphingobium]MDR6707364.1 Ca2+-transporting ATPase [Novosphingobium sp. 1748]ODU83316.1 MAG: ATPase [Novosphingobium sp. SCN 63-17]OJX96414.1 MAG: ATPase [Novosphingobium sp. 63-713]
MPQSAIASPPLAKAATSSVSGLTQAQADALLERDGPNELPRAGRRTPRRIAWEVLREPMLAMLLAAGLIYLALGDRTEAIILLLFALLSIAITIIQESRTENVLEALRDLSAPRALVIRDGQATRIAGRDVVAGDILVLEQGDRVAADAGLLEARELEADEALLTGESVAVRKRAIRPDDRDDAEPGGDDLPLVFSGSIITRGRGLARATATGPRSRIGQIGQSLATLETEAPRLQQETSRVVTLCAIGGLAIAALVVLLYGLLRGSWLDALLAGIATAMSLLPEEFPVVLTIFLAMGAWRIAQVGVLTRRTSAIETMGAATVLCTDKTGTLTQNRMSVAELWFPGGAPSPLAEQSEDPRTSALLNIAALASAPVPVDPMEVAFHAAADEAGGGTGDGMALVRAHGLTPELLAMANVWRDGDDPSLVVAAKGAPEAVGRLCGLGAQDLAGLEAAAQAMAERGMRVLAVAMARIGGNDPAMAIADYPFALLGLAGLADPLRESVPAAVAQCRKAGIRVVMITGDHAATARSIAMQAGIGDGKIMLGADIARLSDEALMACVPDVLVFARTMPDQKLRIVNALKSAGEVVAMTGDGVNDAPALKAAHIGIAMGKRGTDVAREAASIVLVEDDFGAIVEAIRVGRRIYDNIRKALAFIFGVHVPIAGLAILPLLFGLPIILAPLQIALLEMVIDPVCALVFEAEREESRTMERPPRPTDERLFSLPLVRRAVLQGLLALGAVGGIALGADHYGLAPDRARTLSFFALLSAILALIFANRSFSAQLSHALLRHNITFRFVLAFIAIGAALILTLAPIQHILRFAPLHALDFAAVALCGFGLLIAYEFEKRLGRS